MMSIGLASPRGARAFEIYNNTGESVRARVLEGDYDSDISAHDSGACHYSNTDCNPSGARGALLTAQIETSNFNCVITMPAGGVALIDAQDRFALGLPPNYYCTSYDWNDNFIDASVIGQSLSLDPSERGIHFLATGDPQYHNTSSENGTSDAVLGAMLGILRSDRSVRGLLIAGDLTQNARPLDEFADYKDRIRGMSRFVYDGMGNHDLTRPTWDQRLACDFGLDTCVDPAAIRRDIRSRKRSTSATRVGDPHYSWDWQDVHFVQLNLFPGNGTTADQYDSSLDPMGSLEFLRNDLAAHVGPAGRPVVLMHHVGFDPLSTGDGGAGPAWWTAAQRAAYWDVIATYNVAAIFTGHVHLDPDSADWVVPFTRPAGRYLGPDSIPTFVAGGAEAGAFLDVLMKERQLVAIRKDQTGAEHHRAVVPIRRNLALGRPATQSTVAVGGVPALAVDGNLNGAFWEGSVTHTEWERTPWWQVDLGSSTAIGEVVVYNRTDCCSERLTNFSVLVSEDGARWTALPYAGTAPPRLSMTVNQRGRFVRVQLNDIGSTRPFSLTEVEVFAARTSVSVKHSGLLLDVEGGSTADGAALIQWSELGYDNQQFDLIPAGAGYVNIVARHSQKCIDVYDVSTANGAPVIQWSCNGGDNQRFRVVDAGGGYAMLVAKQSGKCLDVEYASTEAGARIIQWPCAGSDNQLFAVAQRP
jgi:hypothetical protein